MEHMVSFTFSVDDAAIEQAAINAAANAAEEAIIGKTTCSIYSGVKMSSQMEGIVINAANKQITELITNNESAIIQGVIKELANKMARSKKYKDVLDKIAEEVEAVPTST